MIFGNNYYNYSQQLNLMSNTEKLFNQTTCYIKGKKESGKVLAISTQENNLRVCFQIKGEYWGIWVQENALFENSYEKISRTTTGSINKKENQVKSLKQTKLNNQKQSTITSI